MKRRLFRISGIALVILLVVFVIWRLKLAHDVNVQLQSIRSAGLPVNAVELDKYYRVVPNDQNAALILEQAFSLLQSYPDVRSNEIYHLISSPVAWQSMTPE